ncbi:hypothetical protein C477_05887 [Haloterrigena salina JCM 13891]|uniref:Uncharacterized protein n=1 Tax=Haloterrigena salina JCM 13891 TaxID=1227488 RepID=M0CCQ3_9EURY|nr:hypothetical protein C477_05887 [Haloterrigena salina JCM 13891]
MGDKGSNNQIWRDVCANFSYLFGFGFIFRQALMEIWCRMYGDTDLQTMMITINRITGTDFESDVLDCVRLAERQCARVKGSKLL